MSPATPRAIAAFVLAALALSACGSSNNNEKSTTATTTKAPAASSKLSGEVPAAVKSKGTLTVAADATYAPNEFIAGNGHTVQGMDADLAQAIASKLGLKAKV